MNVNGFQPLREILPQAVWRLGHNSACWATVQLTFERLLPSPQKAESPIGCKGYFSSQYNPSFSYCKTIPKFSCAESCNKLRWNTTFLQTRSTFPCCQPLPTLTKNLLLSASPAHPISKPSLLPHLEIIASYRCKLLSTKWRACFTHMDVNFCSWGSRWAHEPAPDPPQIKVQDELTPGCQSPATCPCSTSHLQDPSPASEPCARVQLLCLVQDLMPLLHGVRLWQAAASNVCLLLAAHSLHLSAVPYHDEMNVQDQVPWTRKCFDKDSN